MPEPGLFDSPLRVVRRARPSSFPSGWVHQQVTMPARAGVDALAGAVQLIAPGSKPDPDPAVAAAVRHWCGEDLGQLVVRPGSARELSATGSPVLRLTDLELHDPAILQVPGCPLVAVDDETKILWTPATRHRRGGPTASGWVPYGQTVVRWLERDLAQPLAHTMNMAGLGAARTRQAAIEQACGDLVAQDAVMTWWLHGGEQPLARTVPPDDLADAWGDSPLELRLRILPTTAHVETVLAIVLDPDLDVVTLSAAAGREAASHATARALWQHTLAHDLMDPSGSVPRSNVPGILPHRPDRAYLAEAGPGHRRAVDPLAALQLGLDPTVLRRVDERTAIRGPVQHGQDRPGSSLSGLLAAGHDVWIIDLTTADVAAAGWHCVRALATDLVRIPVPAFPLKPTARIAAAPHVSGQSRGALERLPYPGW